MKSDPIKRCHCHTLDGSQKEFSVNSTGRRRSETGATIDARVLGSELLSSPRVKEPLVPPPRVQHWRQALRFCAFSGHSRALMVSNFWNGVCLLSCRVARLRRTAWKRSSRAFVAEGSPNFECVRARGFAVNGMLSTCHMCQSLLMPLACRNIRGTTVLLVLSRILLRNLV